MFPSTPGQVKLNIPYGRQNSYHIDGQVLLGHGNTGHVVALDENLARKIFLCSGNSFMDELKRKDKATEIRVYQRLGDHPCVCKFICEDEDGIVLERLGENLRRYLHRLFRDGKSVGFDRAIEWSCQAAEGLAYIHSKEILQGDIGCHNLLLDQHENLKFCDFAGSSIDGEEPTVCCDIRYQPYTNDSTYPTTVHTELFGLGSIIYEIWTGSMPYQDISDEDVNDHFQKSQFPDVEHLPPASVIRKCWRGSYTNATEVLTDLAQLRAQLPGTTAKRETDNESSSPVMWLFTEHVWNIAILSTTILTAWFLTHRPSK